MIHSFDDKLAQGEAIEEELDIFFAGRGFTIRRASQAEQRRGIDRWFLHRETATESAIDYKADFRAFRTKNAFIETTSVDQRGTPGWAVASQADVILYYVVGSRTIYVLAMEDIRQWLPLWAALFPKKEVKNNGYSTWGLLVPLSEIAAVAKKVLEILR